MRKWTATVVLVLGASGPGGAWAGQDPGATAREPRAPESTSGARAEEPAALPTITVSAQRRSENLQDVALAVSAFGGDELHGIGVTNALDLQAVVPSLVYGATGSVAQPYLRGIGTRQSQLGMEAPIATYVDDRYVSRTYGAMFDMLDVERVEVVKGPQGTLYGRNAAGGAIRAITRDPGEVAAIEIAGKVGAYDHAAFRVLAGGPLSTAVRGQISAGVERRDGFATNLVPGGRAESDDVDRQMLRAKLLWDIGDAAEAKLSLSWWRYRDWIGRDLTSVGVPEANRGVALYGGTTSREREHFASAIADDNDMSETAANLRFDVDLGTVDFVSITTYADSDFDQVFDLDASSTVLQDLHATEKSAAFTQEFQVLSRGAAFDWVVGAFYFREHGNNVFLFPGSVAAPPRFPAGTDVSNGLQHAESEAYALYGQGSYAFSDRISLTLGGRFSRESKRATLEAVPDTFTNAPTPFGAARAWEDFTPRASIEYRGRVGLAYLSYSRGFKSGGYSYPASLNTVLDPDVVESYEAGLKWERSDGRLRINSAVFFAEMEDMQVTRGGVGALIAVENAADAEVRGVEVDFDFAVSDDLGFYAGAAWMDSAYSNYVAAVLVPSYVPPYGSVPLDGGLDVSGRSLLRAPDESLYLGARYERRLASGGRIPVSVNYSYKGSYYFDFSAVPETEWLRRPAQGVLSARVGYVAPGGTWEAGLWATNLTDETYLEDAVLVSAASRVSYADPRALGIDFKIRL